MELWPAMLRRVVMPVGFRIAGSRRMSILHELRLTGRLRGAERRRHQEKALRRLVKEAYEDVPYYHRLFRSRGLRPDDIRTPGDLSKLPPLTRKAIVEAGDDILSQRFRRSQLRTQRTSGSSGTFLTLHQSRRQFDYIQAAHLRSLEDRGLRIGDRRATLHYRDQRTGDRARWKLDLLRRASGGRYWVFGFDADEDLRTLHEMRRYAPKSIGGLTNRVLLAAQRALEERVEIRPRVVSVYGVHLGASRRRTLHDAFDAPVYDSYGTAEFGGMAVECARHDGMHIHDDLHLIESVVDGDRAAPGEVGTLLITGLTGDAMPLLRYDVGDLGRLREEACPCGNPEPLLAGLDGRPHDMIRLPGGAYRFAAFPEVFADELHVLDHQLVRRDEHHFVVRIVPRPGFGDADQERIITAFHRVDPTFRLEVERVAELPVGRGGKPRLYVDERPADARQAEG